MKYYGFRFKTFIVEKSKLNGHVSTWIGLIGTFLFIVSAAESGGFKGRIGDELWLTIVYPAILWFLCLLAVEHRWAKIVIILASGVAILFALLVNVSALVYKSQIVASNILFLILNVGIIILALKKPVSVTTPE